MHEYSIVSNLLDTCEEIAHKNNAKKVCKICVSIGERSGVNAHLLESAFENYKEGSLCKEATLSIKKQPVVLECAKCGEVEANEISYTQCPICGGDARIIKGVDMILEQLELE